VHPLKPILAGLAALSLATGVQTAERIKVDNAALLFLDEADMIARICWSWPTGISGRWPSSRSIP